jgi:hypothetical protein
MIVALVGLKNISLVKLVVCMTMYGTHLNMLVANVIQDIEAHHANCKSVHLVRILSMGMVMKQVVIALDVVYVIILVVCALVLLDTLELDVNIKLLLSRVRISWYS